MAWLLRQGEVLASLEVAVSLAERARQMAGRRSGCTALLVRAPGAHSLGAPDGIDVAYLDGELVVVATLSLRPHRLAMPRLGSRQLLEAPSGAFERWRLAPGDHLEVKE